MGKIKLNVSFIVLVMVNILLFVLYLKEARNPDLFDNTFINDIGTGNIIIIDIVLVFLLMWMLSTSKEKINTNDEKTVGVFRFKNYDLEVEILLADMYDLFQKRPEVNHSVVHFSELKEGYGVDVELNVKEGTMIGDLTKQLQKEIEDVFKDKYDYDGKVEVKFIFKMVNDKGKDENLVPEDVRKELETMEKKKKGKGFRKLGLSKEKIDDISIEPKIEDGKVMFDSDNKDHLYVADDFGEGANDNQGTIYGPLQKEDILEEEVPNLIEDKEVSTEEVEKEEVKPKEDK